MKDIPMLFKGAMVNALNREINPKTNTRRIAIQPPFGCSYVMNGNGDHALCCATESGYTTDKAIWVFPTPTSVDHRIKSPYGGPGDRIWVKETFRQTITDKGKCCVEFRADGNAMYALAENGGEGDFCGLGRTASPTKNNELKPNWKPSIFMPRWASRITLEITKINIERLRDISEEDAKAEGAICAGCTSGEHEPCGYRYGYQDLWNSINLAPSPILKKKEIISYVSYPWSNTDFDIAYPNARNLREFRGKPLTVIENCWVWSIHFKKI